ncbi:indolethylamine N-methyltransferase-like [Glandiceps talaboti]
MVCNLEGHSNVQEREQKLRDTIKDVIYCDVFQPNPIGGSDQIQSFDCVMTNYCIESICTSKEEYVQCLKNVTSLLKIGGTFVQLVEPFSTYMVGDNCFAGFYIDDVNFYKYAPVEAGITDLSFNTMTTKRPVEAGKFDECKYVTCIVGKKK